MQPQMVDTDLQCESKKIPLREPDIFHFFHRRLRIFNRYFTHTPIIRSYLYYITNFYSIIPNFDGVMPY